MTDEPRTPIPPAERQSELSLARLAEWPDLEALHAYWLSLCADGRLPVRLDPIRMPKRLFPYVMLLDIERAPDRLRFRLAGSYFCDQYGGELRGHTTDALFVCDDARLILATARAMACKRRPHLAQRRGVAFKDRRFDYVRLMLPLASPTGTVTCILKAIDPTSIRESDAQV